MRVVCLVEIKQVNYFYYFVVDATSTIVQSRQSPSELYVTFQTFDRFGNFLFRVAIIIFLRDKLVYIYAILILVDIVCVKLI